MAELRGRRPKATYASLLKVEGGLTGTLTPIEGGDGALTPLKLAIDSISLHDLVFPSTGAAAGKVLTISTDGESMEWKTPSASSSGGGGGGTMWESFPDQVNYQYNENEAVSVITELLGSDTRTTTYSYNANGKVENITINYLGQTRVETYTYQDGKVTSMVAIIT